MADEWNSLFNSDDDDSEFEGFSPSDIDETENRSIGSDISISEVDTDSSDDDNPDQINQTWSRYLKKPQVADFREQIGATFQLNEEKKEIDFFHKFFPVSLVEKIVAETNAYAVKCIQVRPDKVWVPTTFPEMMAFLGIHVVFSIVGIPSYTLAWKSTWPFEIPAVPSIMTRTRFERISKYFHMNDTSQNPPRRQPGHDKLCHIRPILNELSRTCLDNYNPNKEQSIDEGMIAFKGRLSFKQYLPAKPTKFGIKVWERASPQNGYCHEFQIYTGKVEGVRTEEGLGSRVIKDLSRHLVGKNHVIYMDNFFSNPALFESLLAEGIYCSGTVRINRRGMPEAIKGVKLKEKGDTFTVQKGNLVATAWKDKKVVTYLSTNCDPTESRVVQRRKKDGTLQNVSAPIVSDLYNKFMFGVDLADQKRMQYSTCRKSKKWYKYLFWFCFDLAVTNALICMQESQNHQKRSKNNKVIKMTQLEFRTGLAQQLIGQFRGTRKRKAPATVGNCGLAHWPTQFDKPGRCKGCTKENRRHEVKIGCKQCDIRLCVKHDCFAKYHEELLK